MTLKNPFSMIQIKPKPKSEVSNEIKELEKETILNLEYSKAPNTIRAYQSDFSDFCLFCSKNGFRSIPTEPKIVSLYLTHLSTNEAKMSTLKRRLVSIGVIHKLKGHYLDTKHPSIIENIMGIKRRKGSIQKGKKPLLISSLKKVINVIDEQNKEEIKSFFCDDIIYFFESHPAYYLESKGDSILIKGKERLASIQEIKQMMAFSEELLRILRNKTL